MKEKTHILILINRPQIGVIHTKEIAVFLIAYYTRILYTQHMPAPANFLHFYLGTFLERRNSYGFIVEKTAVGHVVCMAIR